MNQSFYRLGNGVSALVRDAESTSRATIRLRCLVLLTHVPLGSRRRKRGRDSTEPDHGEKVFSSAHRASSCSLSRGFLIARRTRVTAAVLSSLESARRRSSHSSRIWARSSRCGTAPSRALSSHARNSATAADGGGAGARASLSVARP